MIEDTSPGCSLSCHHVLYHYYAEQNWTYKCASQCCGPISYCPDPSDDYLFHDYSQVENTDDCTHTAERQSGDTNPEAHCDEFPTPTWEDCWNQNGDCTAGKCNMVANRVKVCRGWPFSDHGCSDTEIWECVGCDGNPTGLNCTIPPPGCGFYHSGQSC